MVNPNFRSNRFSGSDLEYMQLTPMEVIVAETSTGISRPGRYKHLNP